MRSRCAVALLAVSSFAAGIPAAAPAFAKADAYKVDPVHTFVTFRIGHLGVGSVHGRFNETSGTVQYDAADPAACSVQIEVKAASVDTGVAKRDDHLRSPDFLNVAQFPTISFKSTAVKKVDGAHVEVTGDLTIHGTTKSVTVTMTVGGPKEDPWKKQRMGFEGTFTIKRADYGVVGMPEPGNEEVRLTIAVEATKEP